MPTLADHLLVLFIVLGLPLRAFYGMRSLRASPVAELPTLRRRIWWRAIASQWALTGVTLFLWYSAGRELTALGLVLKPTAGLAGVLVGLATMASLIVRQRAAALEDKALREQARARLAPVRPLLPAERRDFPAFAVLSTTAGICEEFLFRGYLYWYAARFMSPIAAALLQAVLFGLGHIYQGRKGVVLTGFAGLFFTGIVAVSGSLWAAMLAHALMDLNAGDLAIRVPATEASGEDSSGNAGKGRA
jgi:membrane protease YdiL (CAAX protease family)